MFDDSSSEYTERIISVEMSFRTNEQRMRQILCTRQRKKRKGKELVKSNIPYYSVLLSLTPVGSSKSVRTANGLHPDFPRMVNDSYAKQLNTQNLLKRENLVPLTNKGRNVIRSRYKYNIKTKNKKVIFQLFYQHCPITTNSSIGIRNPFEQRTALLQNSHLRVIPIAQRA